MTAAPSNTSAPLGPIKAVLFDSDGLLIDSESIYTDVVNAILKPYGKEQTWEIKSRLMGTPEKMATEILLSSLWPSDPSDPNCRTISPDCPFDLTNFLADRNEALEAAFRSVKPMPGAQRLVDHLVKHDVPICVATGSKRKNFDIKSGANVPLYAPFGTRVICGDDARLSRGKPTPDIFLLAAREGLGLGEGFKESIRPPGEEWDDKGFRGGEGSVLVFEDAKPGVQAALAAGMKVVWVPDPEIRSVIDKKAEDLGAHQTINSLEDFKPESFGLPPLDD